MLLAGLAVFGACSWAGSFATPPGQLTAARAVMGLGTANDVPFNAVAGGAGGRRAGHRCPMIDVSLFHNPRFTAASASVAIAFFALHAASEGDTNTPRPMEKP